MDRRPRPFPRPRHALLAVLVALVLAPSPADTTDRERRWSRTQESYKKKHRDRITMISDGEVDAALVWFEQYLAENPDDLEALFGLAVAHTRKGVLDQAMSYVERSVDAGLPFGRYLAGPRDLLEPLVSSRAFRKYRKRHPTELLHGPMLGAVTHDSARFWVRTASETTVRIRVRPEEAGRPILSAKVRTERKRDYTAVLEVTALAPATRYTYEVLAAGKPVPLEPPPRLTTFPTPGRSGTIRVGFGSGVGYTPWFERMWDTLREQELSLFLMLGDNVYSDAPTYPDTQRYCYYRRYSRPDWRQFVSRTPIFAIWDDHDFSTNETISGSEIEVPSWKRDVWNVFTENFNNPYYAGGAEQPGVWHDFRIGDIHVFMLDGRYYRSEPEAHRASMLGPVQKRWLLDGLRDSQATFKLLVSPVPWAFGTKPGTGGTGRPRGSDTWEGYPEEREQIFRFIEEQRIEGIVLLSGDRHRSDSWKIPREHGYTFYDWMSARLTNNKFHNSVDSEFCLFSYNELPSFGRLTFETDLPDPTVTYQIIDIDGELHYSQTVRKSELSFDD